MYLRLAKSTQWHSSEIDWCEANYAMSKSVVEFYNTFSNIPLLVLPAVVLLLCRDYTRHVSRDLFAVNTLIVVVGLSSMYFHATLSMAGQLLDELSILWVGAAGCANWVDLRHFPSIVNHSRGQVKVTVFVLAGLCTGLGCLFPAVNMFALMGLSLFLCKVVTEAIFKYPSSSPERKIGRRSTTIWVIGMLLWAVDKFGCSPWMSSRFPYFHAIWHVAAGFGAYPVAVLLASIKARETFPRGQVALQFWPSYSGGMGIPYISISMANNNDVQAAFGKWEKQNEQFHHNGNNIHVKIN